MASSPSHQLGQFIGYMLESAIIAHLKPITADLNLYLDFKHPRAARNGLHEVCWRDAQGNNHKLDIVLEKGGSETQFGSPVAFIEIAWRRYTKHSKNKVQEISGAILPIANVFSQKMPFCGAILAGEFTQSSIDQIRSVGFRVLHFPLTIIEQSYAAVGVDIHWEENTSDEELIKKINQLENLSLTQKNKVISEFIRLNKTEIDNFCQQLKMVVSRSILNIKISVLYGNSVWLSTAEEACQYIAAIPQNAFHNFAKIEIDLLYTTGDQQSLVFLDISSAILYLRSI